MTATKAWKEVRSYTNLLRNFIELEEDIERAGSFDKFIVEKEGRLRALEGEAAKVTEQLEATRSACAEKLAAADTEAQRRRAAAEHLIVEAQDHGHEIELQNERAIENATAVIARDRAAADRDLQVTGEKVAELRRQVAAASLELSDVIAQRNQAQQRLDDVNAELARLLSRFEPDKGI